MPATVESKRGEVSEPRRSGDVDPTAARAESEIGERDAPDGSEAALGEGAPPSPTDPAEPLSAFAPGLPGLFDLVRDRERFETLFRRAVDGPRIRGETVGRTGVVPEGATLVFGPGVNELELGFAPPRFPPDVRVVGAGMDRTLLLVRDLLSGQIPSSSLPRVRALSFADATIRTGAMYDNHHGRPLTLKLERCRVIGFDETKGSSSLVAAKTAAVHMVDCRIEAGFSGDDPGAGHLFWFSSGGAARLDRCLVRGPLDSLTHDLQRTASAIVFSDCTFEEFPERLQPEFESPVGGVRFVNCRIRYRPTHLPPAPRRSVRELNPDWAIRPN